jgi:poly(A) polymerase
MDIPCTEKELFVFKKISQAADELNMPCYVIGGFVRDKLLGRGTKDVDVVCVGDGITLAHCFLFQKFRHRTYSPEGFFW